jgi:hypothetical protein
MTYCVTYWKSEPKEKFRVTASSGGAGWCKPSCALPSETRTAGAVVPGGVAAPRGTTGSQDGCESPVLLPFWQIGHTLSIGVVQ